MSFSKQFSRKAAGVSFVMTCLCVVYVIGISRKTLYLKKEGDLSIPIACAIDAEGIDTLAVKYDASQNCQNLGWEWGHVYDGISTYFEKQHVVKEYNEPMVLGGQMRLPIIFDNGAYIDMYIEFTSVSFTYGSIQLLDVLQGAFDVYDSIPETVMISLEMTPLNNGLMLKTWRWGWLNRNYISPFPFETGIVYKITFKALGDEIEILVNDQQYDKYAVGVHSTEGRLLTFSDVGMLLHKIEFVA